MIIEQIGPAACRSYLVACGKTNKALIVDPLIEDTDRVLERLDRDGLELTLIVDTHTHADHLTGGAQMAERTGVPFALHEKTESPFPDEKLRDGQVIEVGEERVEVVHTPGHTSDSVTLRCGPNLFTGDFLFLAQDGAGRLDLPGCDPGAHWDSLQKLSGFGEEHRVLPGHDYNELTDSTLGVERRRNPRFQNVTREEYVAWQKAIAMPTPDWMLDVIAKNLGREPEHRAHHGTSAVDDLAACVEGGGGACSAGPMFRAPMIWPETAHQHSSRPEAPPFLLDVREEWEYEAPHGRHAVGAVLIPLGELPHRLDELPQDREAELMVICKTGGRSAQAAEFLIEQGWRRVLNVATGTDGWVRSGLPVES